MKTLKMVQNNKNNIIINVGDLQELNGSFNGELITPESEKYNNSRTVWNGLIDKHPALIARCLDTKDIVEAVNFARKHELLVSVRGGGHNVAGNAICDAGLVIDLSAMKDVYVDPDRRTARVQPGADWGDVDRETQRHGLVTPGGQISKTGVAGLTLGGGMGYLRRKWGLSCDNLLSVEIVTADGQILTASEDKNEDLFWAIRGGGGNFGIVTSFEFRLHPLGPEIYGALTVYPFEEAATVLRNWRDFALKAPDEVTCDANIWGMPPLPNVPAEMHWKPVVIIAGMYAGAIDEAVKQFEPVSAMGTPIADMSGPRPYVAMQSDLDPLFADGQLCYWKSLFADHISDALINEIVTVADNRPSPQCLITLRSLGGAMRLIPENATAYANRSARCNISIDNTWQDLAQNNEMIDWTRKAWTNLRNRTGGGVYSNFVGFGEENDMLAKAAFGSNYERLQKVKSKYDPGNLFRMNLNIKPE